MGEQQMPAWQQYVEDRFLPKDRFGPGLEASARGIYKGLAASIGDLFKQRDDEISSLKRANADLTARLEELESAVTLLRAVKPIREHA